MSDTYLAFSNANLTKKLTGELCSDEVLLFARHGWYWKVTMISGVHL